MCDGGASNALGGAETAGVGRGASRRAEGLGDGWYGVWCGGEKGWCFVALGLGELGWVEVELAVELFFRPSFLMR